VIERDVGHISPTTRPQQDRSGAADFVSIAYNRRASPVKHRSAGTAGPIVHCSRPAIGR